MDEATSPRSLDSWPRPLQKKVGPISPLAIEPCGLLCEFGLDLDSGSDACGVLRVGLMLSLNCRLTIDTSVARSVSWNSAPQPVPWIVLRLRFARSRPNVLRESCWLAGRLRIFSIRLCLVEFAQRHCRLMLQYRHNILDRKFPAMSTPLRVTMFNPN